MAEQIKTTAEQEQEIREIRREFQELLNSQGWVRLAKIADAQINQRMQMLLARAGTQDGLVDKEYAAGEAAGLKLIFTLPESIVAIKEKEVEDMMKANGGAEK